MDTRLSIGAVAVALALAVAAPARAQVTKEDVPGVENFATVAATVGCGGVITPAAVAELKQKGFKSIFDLQLATEKGADIDGQSAAAREAGLNFIHVPFTPAKPDVTSVDRFLAEIRKPENEPAFIHCSGGNRAAGFWLIKRMMVDGWDETRAMKEASALGLWKSSMKKFALDYVHAHQK